MNTARQSSAFASIQTLTRCIIVASALLSGTPPVAALNTHARLSFAHIDGDGLNLLQLPAAHVSEVSKPVPAVVRCIVIMSCQFLVIHIALSLCRTVHELRGTAKSRLESALSAAGQTVTYGPMLCALFITCHMRVKHLSHGKEEPPEWMQTCMYALAFSVLVSAVLVLVIQLITGKPLPPNLKAGPYDLEVCKEEEQDNKIRFYMLTTVRYLFLFALCGGFAAMILGILSYVPRGTKQLGDIEAPEPAIMCTIILSGVFFSSQFIIAVCRSYLECTRVENPQVMGILHAAATTTEIAPMLAVLFLACHMRAFQHDAPPQDWAQSCMLASTGATCVMSLLAFLVPLSLGAVLKSNTWTNTWAPQAKFMSSRQQKGHQQRCRMLGEEVTAEVPSPILGYVFVTMRYFCMLCVHGGAAGVMISIIAFESPGPLATMPASPALQCVVNLMGPFFFVYFVMTLMLTASELNGGTMPLERWRMFPAVEAARSTLALSPVLSLIFVATRLLGLSLVGANGGLQSLVQSAMSLSTWSLQMSGLMCLATGLIMAPVEVDSERNVINKFSRWHLGMAMVALRYIAMLLVYGCLFIVVFGIFTLTPDDAIERSPKPLQASMLVS